MWNYVFASLYAIFICEIKYLCKYLIKNIKIKYLRKYSLNILIALYRPANNVFNFTKSNDDTKV